MKKIEEKGLYRAFESIKNQANELLNKIESDVSYFFKNIKEASIADSTLALTRLGHKIEETKSLITSYNTLRSPFEKLTGINLRLLVMPSLEGDYISSIGKVCGSLRELMIESNRAIGILENIVSPLTLEEKTKLEPLKEELSKISMQIKDINFEKNLGIAINEYEKGDYLCAWLIAGRVIVFILQCIPGKDINEKVVFLEEKGIITRDEKDVVNFIIKTDKETRDIVSHTISTFPTSADAISLIADCMKLLEKIWIKYEPIREMSKTK